MYIEKKPKGPCPQRAIHEQRLGVRFNRRCRGSKKHTDGTIVEGVGWTISDKVSNEVVGKDDKGYGCCYVVVSVVSILDSGMEVEISGFC
ncbi:hypothetical protein VNO78_03374 [Psophocarpus tetragonolobus]|uniref:Uncharacterized protein n=1 Tax=Psophocarpus tetragonolobus TaxID=3891 RepID=A0AAN9XVJ2_PSOTE